ncbi:hypothetical protein [Paenibacillus arenilitoris]|uniref:Restriction endonuclease n=1 Tax=Paenibacillus arenilitoris TaxID=2772299 RepID=A0A927CS97_9BACL|nr:hypothetical protein [Paenibacillus arenilitoris]MBD2872550.1 hypothetical protein [Paenibacillus arenilitoris]
MDIQTVLSSLAETRPIFHNEADFQHALAWELRELGRYDIRLERRIDLNNGQRTYLDILAEKEGRKIAIELKYKMRGFKCTVKDETFSLLNQGAHDIGRYDILKDLQRLEGIVGNGLADEGFLVFLTNDPSYYTVPHAARTTVDQAFRIHEGKLVHGLLSWGQTAGAGTTKGREAAIAIQGHYELSWLDYSRIDDSAHGRIRALIVRVHAEGLDVENIDAGSQGTEDDVVEVKDSMVQLVEYSGLPSDGIMNHIQMIKDIPLSQFDLQHKLSQVLSEQGYNVQTNRSLGSCKIDIWAEKGLEQLAVEVRYKTGLLQSLYNGKSVHLKNQAAQDISRYDYWKDVEKLENTLQSRHDVKGYALLITNDHSYWEKSARTGTVDEDFRIHNDREVHGRLAWKGASGGTTHSREGAIQIQGHYRLHWQPFLNLGSGKNQTFKVLAVEIKPG